ncbi:MAG: hypothetical protein ACOCRA_03285 [Halobacteria archaeon]
MHPDREDSAVSEIVGVVLLITVVLLLLSLYQVYGVPNQNREIEFKHSQGVRGDFLDVRNALLETKRTGQGVSTSFELAPGYPARLVGLNPPPATGTLETTENSTLEVLNQANNPVEVCPVTDRTRMIEYDAEYNVYEEGPTMRYENTVAYADYEDEDAVRFISGQRLFEGQTVNLLIVQPGYRESGSGVASFEPTPGRVEERRVNSPTVTVETELSENEWEGLLEDEVDATDVDVTNGVLTVEADGVYTVSCSVVGTRGTPPGGAGGVDDGNGTGEDDINPAGPGNVEFVGGEIIGQGNGPPGQQRRDVRLTFQNTATEAVNITEARIAFYYQSAQPARADITEADLYDSPTPTSNLRANLVILDPSVELSQPITFDGESTEEISLRFDVRPDENDFFVMDLTFENGESGTYFISMS